MNTATILPLPSKTNAGESILRLPQVMQQVGLSRSTIYTLQKQGKFPKKVPLTGGRSVGWISGEVSSWLAERAAARQEAA